MRTREEILSEAKTADRSYDRPTSENTKLILEVLLDIRDLLSKEDTTQK